MLPRFSRKIDQFPQGNQEHVYYGEKNVLQEHCVDAQVCPDLVLAFIAAAGAFALLGMYTAATQNTNGRRRKRRRSLDGYATPEILDVPLMILIGNNDKIMSSQLCACVLFTNGGEKMLAFYGLASCNSLLLMFALVGVAWLLQTDFQFIEVMFYSIRMSECA